MEDMVEYIECVQQMFCEKIANGGDDGDAPVLRKQAGARPRNVPRGWTAAGRRRDGIPTDRSMDFDFALSDAAIVYFSLQQLNIFIVFPRRE
jgi:hypothetical protein